MRKTIKLHRPFAMLVALILAGTSVSAALGSQGQQVISAAPLTLPGCVFSVPTHTYTGNLSASSPVNFHAIRLRGGGLFGPRYDIQACLRGPEGANFNLRLEGRNRLSGVWLKFAESAGPTANEDLSVTISRADGSLIDENYRWVVTQISGSGPYTLKVKATRICVVFPFC